MFFPSGFEVSVLPADEQIDEDGDGDFCFHSGDAALGKFYEDLVFGEELDVELISSVIVFEVKAVFGDCAGLPVKPKHEFFGG